MSRFFGPAIQTAFVVRNIDDHIQRCVEIGMGPFFVTRKLMLHMLYRGERRVVPIDLAVTYSGSMMYEYLEPLDSQPSPYSDFLAQHPEGGLHHFAYFCEDHTKALDQAKSLGGEFDIVMELYTAEGSLIEIYTEPKDCPGAMLAQLVVPGPFGQFFDQMEAAAAEWDGTKPVRSMIDLLPEALKPPRS